MRSTPALPWHAIDTVLLDMDGTILDLHYDNVLWNERLPEVYGAANGISVSVARRRLLDHMQQVQGTLDFYCIDYWETHTGLDLVALHEELAHLIVYRPQAREFLLWLKQQAKRVILITNAHRKSLAVKHANSGISHALEHTVSCHDYGAPKEEALFWQHLQQQHPFDPTSTLFIDDNQAVLDSARAYGIEHLRAIGQPDSNRPARSVPGYQICDNFLELTGDSG